LDPLVSTEVVQFQRTLDFVRSTALLITCVILSLFLLFYCVGKSQGDWVTHEEQYRWFYSAAYLSGNGAAAVLIVLIVAVLTLSVFLVKDHSKSHGAEASGAESHSGASDDQNEPAAVDKLLPMVVLFVLDALCVLCVQGAFVYVITWHHVSPMIVVMLQALLACFSIVWDNVVVLKVLIVQFALSTQRRIQLTNLIVIFNGVVAPVIVVGMTDPNCFSELIATSETISTTSSLEYCVNIHTYGCSNYLTMVSRVCK
jgi:hypothetical protein